MISDFESAPTELAGDDAFAGVIGPRIMCDAPPAPLIAVLVGVLGPAPLGPSSESSPSLSVFGRLNVDPGDLNGDVTDDFLFEPPEPPCRMPG